MPANAALYLPTDDVDLSALIPGTKPVRGLFRGISAFRIPLQDTSIQLNVMRGAELAEHLRGFVAYIDSLEDSPADKEAAKSAIAKTRTALGLQTELEWEGEEGDELCDLLQRINDHYQGCVFMFDSIVLHGENKVLVGPLKGTVD